MNNRLDSILNWVEATLEKLIFVHPNKTKIVLNILTFLSFFLLFGWKLALVSHIGLIVHEYGHILALNLLGIEHKGFFPLPFLGGITVYNALDVKKYSNQFIIAILGPVIGSALAIAGVFGYVFTHWNWLGASAGLMIVLNLFNLIPTALLDGGSMYDCIVSGFSPNLKKISYSLMSAAVLALGLSVYKLSPFVSLTLVVAALIQFLTRVVRQPANRFEEINSPVVISLCVIAYLLAIIFMLLPLSLLVGVDFNVMFR